MKAVVGLVAAGGLQGGGEAGGQRAPGSFLRLPGAPEATRVVWRKLPLLLLRSSVQRKEQQVPTETR